MPGSDNTITNTINTPIVGDKDHNSKELGWRELFRIMMYESTSKLKKQKLALLKELASSQSEISFLNNLRSILMIGANTDGTFDVNDQLKALLEKVSNPGSESLMGMLDELGFKFTAKHSEDSFKNLFDSLDKLPQEEGQAIFDKLSEIGITKYPPPPTQEQLDALVKLAAKEDNMKLRKLLTDHKILGTKDKFTKGERESLIESIHVNVNQKQTIHGTNSQKALHMETLINQMQERVPDIQKTLKRIFDKIIDNFKRN
jgi:hypothetical protein